MVGVGKNFRRGQGFTLIELLVVVAIIALLIAILIPALGKAREISQRSTCAANLNGIGKAMIIYAGAEADMYPTQPAPDAGMLGMWNNPTYASGYDGSREDGIADLFTDNGVPGFPYYSQMGDPMANLWLLVLREHVTPKQFICPADPTSPKQAAQSYASPEFAGTGYFQNFGAVGTEASANTNSYSFAYPWHAAATTPGVWWKNTLNASVPIGSDMAPSGISGGDDPTASGGSKLSNSKNHGGGLGQNIVFADGHVEFSRTNRVGTSGDNIFCADGDTVYVAVGCGNFSGGLTFSSISEPVDVIMVPARP